MNRLAHRLVRSATLFAAAGSLFACGTGPGAEFRAGVPTSDMVTLKVPAKATAGLSEQGVQGQESSFYQLTRGATGLINGGTVAVLELVKKVTSHTPTTVSGNSAVWGPYTDALAKNTWKLTVTKTSEKHFSYVLEGKDKTADDSHYVAVLSGTHVATDVEDYGSGEFLLDWEKAKTLPDHDNNVGSADISYSREQSTGVVTVTASFANVRDGDTGNLISANYGYSDTAGVGGTFDFATNKNVDSDPSRGAVEHLSVRSRWNLTGAGRADVRVTHGDLGDGQATANECWDSNFVSRFLGVSYDPSLNYGTESTDCAFAAADYSNL